MSFKYPKNVIVIVGAIAALMAGTVLLGGYANSKPADTDAPVKACQAKEGSSCCPSMANTAAFAQVSGDVPTAAGCPIMAGSDQAASCCAEKQADGTCEMPCPTDCPKPCCAGTPAEGCCAAKTAVE